MTACARCDRSATNGGTLCDDCRASLGAPHDPTRHGYLRAALAHWTAHPPATASEITAWVDDFARCVDLLDIWRDIAMQATTPTEETT